MNATSDDQKKTRLRFIGLYAISLLLIFVVVSAFWKKEVLTTAADPVPPPSENVGYFLQLDTMLHAKMDQLDNVYAAYLKGTRVDGDKETADLLSTKYYMTATLDSIEKLTKALNDGVKKRMMDLVVARFRTSFEARNSLMNELSVLPKSKAEKLDKLASEEKPLMTSEEIDELKNILVDKEEKIADLEKKLQDNNQSIQTVELQTQKDLAEKNKYIASLETQLKQKGSIKVVSPTNTVAGETEWKQKYTAMKAAYDKKAASEASLKSAYKTVADDNRRLLSQLQSMKRS